MEQENRNCTLESPSCGPRESYDDSGLCLDVESAKSGKPEAIWGILDVARFLGMHPQTIYRMAKIQEIPGAQIGTRWKFRPSDVDNWLRAKVTSPRTLRRQ